jgi:hypothetical protein
VIVLAIIRAAQNYAAQRIESWIASKRRAVARGQAPALSDDVLERPNECVQRAERELADLRPPASDREAWIP